MIRTAVTVSVMLSSLVGALVAQEKEMTLTLSEARGGYCISYLIDPAIAAELTPPGSALASAGKGAAVSPFLARVIQDEPQFGAWIPAAICIGRYGAAAIDGREVARIKSDAKPDKVITVIMSWVSVIDPLGVSGASAVLLSLSASESRVLRRLQEFGVAIDERNVLLFPADAEDTQLDLKLEKTKISWIGHPTGEPRVSSTQAMSFGYAGQRNSTWRVTAAMTGGESRLMVGALRVVGKDILAKALKSSPIRAVGPQQTGGTTELTFHRLPSR